MNVHCVAKMSQGWLTGGSVHVQNLMTEVNNKKYTFLHETNYYFFGCSVLCIKLFSDYYLM